LVKAVTTCLAGGLIRESGSERLEVTDVGRVCAGKGVGVETGAALARWAVEAQSVAIDDLEVLTMVSLTPGGADIYVGLTREERNKADYRGELLARVAGAGVASRPVLAKIAADLASLEYDATKALKK